MCLSEQGEGCRGRYRPWNVLWITSSGFRLENKNRQPNCHSFKGSGHSNTLELSSHKDSFGLFIFLWVLLIPKHRRDAQKRKDHPVNRFNWDFFFVFFVLVENSSTENCESSIQTAIVFLEIKNVAVFYCSEHHEQNSHLNCIWARAQWFCR